MANKSLQDTLDYNRYTSVSFLPENLKSHENAVFYVVFQRQMRERSRNWFNKIQGPGETGCSHSEDEEAAPGAQGTCCVNETVSSRWSMTLALKKLCSRWGPTTGRRARSWERGAGSQG